MNRTVVGVAAIMVLGVASCQVGQRAQEEHGTSRGSHLGTWELVSIKYGEQQEFSDFPENRRRIKHITETHYTWVEFDTSIKKVENGAGGSYSLNGDTYIESKDFAGEGMMKYLGKKSVYTIRVEGDKLNLSGSLAGDFKIEEVWHRLK